MSGERQKFGLGGNRSMAYCNKEEMDDDGLIAAVAAGDDSALRELLSRHGPWLAARLRRVLPAAEVEDVLQETFLAVWRGAAGYRPAAPRAAGCGGSPGARPRCGCAAAGRPGWPCRADAG